MVSCSVPYCKSTSKKGSGFKRRFYEFPSNAEARNKWIKNISRKAEIGNGLWHPGPSGRDSICDLHFTEDDFRTDLKVRRLKPGAVPTIFPGYPSYKQPTKRSRPPPKKRRIQVDKTQVKKRKIHVATNNGTSVENQQTDLTDFNQINTEDASSEFIIPDTYQVNAEIPHLLAKFEPLNSESKDSAIPCEATFENDTNKQCFKNTVQAKYNQGETTNIDAAVQKKTTVASKKPAKLKSKVPMNPCGSLEDFGFSSDSSLSKGKSCSKYRTNKTKDATVLCNSQKNSKNSTLVMKPEYTVDSTSTAIEEQQPNTGVRPCSSKTRDSTTENCEMLRINNANQNNFEKTAKIKDNCHDGINKTNLGGKGRNPFKDKQRNSKEVSPQNRQKVTKSSKIIIRNSATIVASGKNSVSETSEATNPDNSTRLKCLDSTEGIPLPVTSKLSDFISKNSSITDGQGLNLGSTTEGNSKRIFLLIEHKIPDTFGRNSANTDRSAAEVGNINKGKSKSLFVKHGSSIASSDNSISLSGCETSSENVIQENYRNILLLIRRKMYGSYVRPSEGVSKEKTKYPTDIGEENPDNVPVLIKHNIPEVVTNDDKPCSNGGEFENTSQFKMKAFNTVADSTFATSTKSFILPNIIQDGEKITISNSSQENSKNTLKGESETFCAVTDDNIATNTETSCPQSSLVPLPCGINVSKGGINISMDRKMEVIDSRSQNTSNALIVNTPKAYDAFSDNNIGIVGKQQGVVKQSFASSSQSGTDISGKYEIVVSTSENNATLEYKQKTVSEEIIAGSKQSTNVTFAGQNNSDVATVIKREIDEADADDNVVVDPRQQAMNREITSMRHQSTYLNAFDQEDAQSSPLLIISDVCNTVTEDSIVTSEQMTATNNIKQENDENLAAHISFGGQVKLLPENLESRSQTSRLKREIQKLKNKLQLKDNMLSDQLTKNILSIKTKSQEGDKSALFLLELLNNYGRERRHWSEVTIRHCLTWRKFSVMGYEFARQSGLLHLPSKSTLNKFLRLATGKGRGSSEQSSVVQNENNSSVDKES